MMHRLFSVSYKNKLRLLCGILLALLVAACEKDFVVEESLAARRIVVNAQLGNYWPVQVYVTESNNLTQQEQLRALPNAQVQLFENEVWKETLQYVPSDTADTFGSFRSQLIPQPGNNYRVEVVHSGLPDATATDAMPTAPQLNVQLDYPATVQDSMARLLLNIADHPQQANAYGLFIWWDGERREWDPVLNDSVMNYYSNAFYYRLNTPVPDTAWEWNALLRFSDEGFNGQQQQLQFDFSAVQPQHFEWLHVYAHVISLSPATWQYYRSLYYYRLAPYGSEPVELFSNVQNGYGFFGGTHSQFFEWVIK